MLVARLATNCELDLIRVATSEEATAAARAASVAADVVVAVGGDGTVADVATGIIGSGALLGIVPAGSTNITARTLAIPANPARAISILGRHVQPRQIDIGLSDDRVFLHMAGAGLDAELFQAASPLLKRRLGWLAYFPAAAEALRLAPSRVEVTIDGARIEDQSSLVLVANGSSVIAPALKIDREIAIDDGWLDVFVFTATTPLEFASTLGHAGLQQIGQSRFVTWNRARQITIEATPPLSIELDGDMRGSTPREFRITPAGLSVLAPARRGPSLWDFLSQPTAAVAQPPR